MQFLIPAPSVIANFLILAEDCRIDVRLKYTLIICGQRTHLH